MTTISPKGNIDGGQKTIRLMNGIVMSVLDVGLAGWLVESGRPWWTLLFLFPLHLGAAFGFIQYRASTCVLLASRGTCHLGGQADKVEDPEVREALAARGRAIARRSFWIAVALTVVSVLVIRAR